MIVSALLPVFMPTVDRFLITFLSQRYLWASHLRFSKRGPVQRARVGNDQTLTIPVQHRGRPEPIRDKQLDLHSRWRGQHLRFLKHHLHHSAYFDELFHEIEALYADDDKRLDSFLLAWHAFYRKRLGLDTEWTTPAENDAPFRTFLEQSRANVYLCHADNPPMPTGFRSLLNTLHIQPRAVHPPVASRLLCLDFIFRHGPEAPLIFREWNERCTLSDI
ncbi:MAG: hypothetical protein D6677_12570 [Calditrichaeota bacterium]|nr:MAG: hypothetical protein D6677_12570 [Calditrichota bacterium]